MRSYQNLVLLKNLYRLKSIGFNYIEDFNANQETIEHDLNSIEDLFKSIQTCHLCDLSKSRQQSMGGYGNKNADIMIIDYTVSRIQDTQNSYYCGNSGESLKKMIENVIGLKTQDVFMTHLIKCRPANSNTPSMSEWNSCKSYLFSQIEFIKPKIIIALGKDVYEKLTSLNNFESIRGHIIDFKQHKLIPVYNPQFLLRNPNLKKIMLNDLNTIKSFL